MLNDYEAATEMTRFMKNAISFMKRKGYVLPSILVMSKGKPLDIEVSHPSILSVSTNYDKDSFGEPEQNMIYEYGISLRIDKDYKDSFIVDISEEITREYEPDAIGVLSACLLREEITTKSAQKDPGSIRVMFMNYYLKGNREPQFMCTPYLKTKNEDPGWGEDAFAISTISTSWNMGMDKSDLLLPYPYLK